MSRDSIRAGSTGRLRVQFLDTSGVAIQATGVTVDLFAPGLNPDVDSPTVSNLTPNYLGNGVFELVFTALTPEGQWTDKWTGTVLGDSVSAQQKFNIIASGSIASYSINGIGENTLVEILLSKDIKDINGTSLGSDFNFFYTTTYSPLYSSARKVKLDAGGILHSLPDDTINLAILEASIEADVLTFKKQVINENVYIHARRQYVTALAALGLTQNILANGGVVKSKALADFKVDYDVNVLSDLLNKLNDNIKKWESQVQTGGGARTVRNSRMVVKGELDPDRPAIGRLWHGLTTGETPIGNNKYKTAGHRRFKTGWLPKSTRGSNGGEW